MKNNEQKKIVLTIRDDNEPLIFQVSVMELLESKGFYAYNTDDMLSCINYLCDVANFAEMQQALGELNDENRRINMV